ncbi:MAG: hypothetical protein HY046_03190 [Acidobacteria bacterium]|nr:hypothetical protein [Acidobacteriota bacterium]
MIRQIQTGAVAFAAAAFIFPSPSFGWGANAQKVITSKAVETLPPELRSFFEANRQSIQQSTLDTMDSLAKAPPTSVERRSQYIYLDRYGRFPFDNLPRDFKTAVARLTKRVVDSNGVLPWQIGLYSEKLTNAMKAGKWDEARQLSAVLAYYVSAAHDPFNTTDNFDGHFSGQVGVNQRFGSNLVERFSLFFFVRPNDAIHVADPTDRAFEICLSAHSWLDGILLADRRARRGLPDYTDEYYDRFYNQAGAVLIRQISDAATDVGSFWLTAWINAGRPTPPPR